MYLDNTDLVFLGTEIATASTEVMTNREAWHVFHLHLMIVFYTRSLVRVFGLI